MKAFVNPYGLQQWHKHIREAMNSLKAKSALNKSKCLYKDIVRGEQHPLVVGDISPHRYHVRMPGFVNVKERVQR